MPHGRGSHECGRPGRRRARAQLSCARFKSGTIPQSDVLLRTLPAIRACLTGLWGTADAFMGRHLDDCRRALASRGDDVDVRVLEGVGHWVPYEAAHEVNRALLEILARL